MTTLGVAVLIVLIVGAWDAMADNWRSAPAVTQAAKAPEVSQAGGDAARVVQPAARTRPRPATPPAATPPAATPTAPPAASPVLEPVIAEGRRELGDSMYAVRSGQEVTVFFDTEQLRTRLDWKFEGVVRATLPLVFGSVVATVLDSIPTGTLAQGDLFNDLPNRGITIRLSNATLTVWPVTRPGRDGPLVVAYRAQASR